MKEILETLKSYKKFSPNGILEDFAYVVLEKILHPMILDLSFYHFFLRNIIFFAFNNHTIMDMDGHIAFVSLNLKILSILKQQFENNHNVQLQDMQTFKWSREQH